MFGNEPTTAEPTKPGPQRRARLGLPHPVFGSTGAALAVLLLLLAYGLRLYRLGFQSIWYDEGFSVYLAGQSAHDILTRVEPDHLPLYFLILHGWLPVFGQSELAIRYLSLTFGLLAVPATYVLGRRLFGPWVGAAAAVLAAASPYLVYYSQETRMYSVIALQAALSTYFLSRAPTARRLWVAYALVTVSMLYTHYYTLLLVLAQGCAFLVWLLFDARQHGRAGVRSAGLPFLGAVAAIGLAFLPWAIQRAYVFDAYVSAARASLTLDSIVWKSLVAFSLGHSVEALNANQADPGYAANHALAIWLSLGFVVVAALGFLGKYLSQRVKGSGEDAPSGFVRPGLLLAVLLVVPVLGVYAVSVGRREFTARYLTPVFPVYLVLLACGLAYLRRRSRLLLALGVAFVVGSFGFSLVRYYGDSQFWRDDFRSAAAYIGEQRQPGQVVVCDAGYSALALDYYRRGDPSCERLPAQYPPDQAATEARLATLVQSSSFVWLSLWQDYYSDPEQYVEKWLDSHALPVDEKRFRGGIRLKGYLTRPPIVDEAAVPNKINQPLGDRVRLVGYDLSRPVAGEDARITLYWQALAPISEDYTVFVHAVSTSGETLAQQDSRPVSGNYPTSRWQVGQIVKDEHRLAIPAYTPPVTLQLQVGMYELSSQARLSGPSGDKVSIDGFTVGRGTVDAPTGESRLDATFGGEIALLGFDLGDVKPGAVVPLNLYWRAVSRVDSAYTVFVHLVDASGQIRAQLDSPPARGVFPTDSWQPGDTVRDSRSLSVPSDLPGGEYRLVVGLYDPRSGQRLSVRTGWFSTDDELPLQTFSLD